MAMMDYFGTGSPHEERLQVFYDTIAMLDADYGTWNTPWGEVNRFQRLTGDIDLQFDDEKPSLPIGMASGAWGALASYGARAWRKHQAHLWPLGQQLRGRR